MQQPAPPARLIGQSLLLPQAPHVLFRQPASRPHAVLLQVLLLWGGDGGQGVARERAGQHRSWRKLELADGTQDTIPLRTLQDALGRYLFELYTHASSGTLAVALRIHAGSL
jgi:hypothetical protein